MDILPSLPARGRLHRQVDDEHVVEAKDVLAYTESLIRWLAAIVETKPGKLVLPSLQPAVVFVHGCW